LYATHLRSADPSNADLCNADLSYVDLRDAILSYVDLSGATYAPASRPPNPYVAGINGLSTLHAPPGEQIGLVQLRKPFKEAGLRDDERAATYSIEHRVTLGQ
jgi:uncharacterized protein YjbI with pentapeptide repeats